MLWAAVAPEEMLFSFFFSYFNATRPECGIQGPGKPSLACASQLLLFLMPFWGKSEGFLSSSLLSKVQFCIY